MIQLFFYSPNFVGCAVALVSAIRVPPARIAEIPPYYPPTGAIAPLSAVTNKHVPPAHRRCGGACWLHGGALQHCVLLAGYEEWSCCMVAHCSTRAARWLGGYAMVAARLRERLIG